jgi:hypothetical protein
VAGAQVVSTKPLTPTPLPLFPLPRGEGRGERGQRDLITNGTTSLSTGVCVITYVGYEESTTYKDALARKLLISRSRFELSHRLHRGEGRGEKGERKLIANGATDRWWVSLKS